MQHNNIGNTAIERLAFRTTPSPNMAPTIPVGMATTANQRHGLSTELTRNCVTACSARRVSRDKSVPSPCIATSTLMRYTTLGSAPTQQVCRESPRARMWLFVLIHRRTEISRPDRLTISMDFRCATRTGPMLVTRHDCSSIGAGGRLVAPRADRLRGAASVAAGPVLQRGNLPDS